MVNRIRNQTNSEWLNEYQQQRGNSEMDMTQYAGNESKYLKASDLQGKKIKAFIDSVELVEFDDDDKGKHEKPVVSLRDKEKKLVLNASNTQELISAYGSDSDLWANKEIGLSTKYYKAFDREGLVVTPIDAATFEDDDVEF
jgi:hypothetical protein